MAGSQATRSPDVDAAVYGATSVAGGKSAAIGSTLRRSAAKVSRTTTDAAVDAGKTSASATGTAIKGRLAKAARASAVAAPAPTPASGVGRAGALLGKAASKAATPLTVIGGASQGYQAYTKAKADGQSTAQALGEGAKGAAPAAGGLAMGAALARAAPALAARMTPVGLVAMGAKAAYDGYQGYQQNGWSGAAQGAADSVTFGLASWAYGKGTEAAHAMQDAWAGKPSVNAGPPGASPTGGAPSPQQSGGEMPGMMRLGGPQEQGDRPKKPTSGEAFGVWDRMTTSMENGTMHKGVERQYGPMQDAMRHSVEKRGGGMFRALGAEKERSSPGPQGSLSPDQSRAFASANQHYADSHMTGHSPPSPDGGSVGAGAPGKTKQPPVNGLNGNSLRGFQIPKVQASAQAAKGNQYNGPDGDDTA